MIYVIKKKNNTKNFLLLLMFIIYNYNNKLKYTIMIFNNNLNKDQLFIEGDTDNPTIILDKKQNRFEFKGNSLPEDAYSVYHPIMEWFELYKQSPNKKTNVIFNMNYINSSTAKMLHKIIVNLNEICLLGNDFNIEWHYDMGDEEMLLDGKTFLEEMSISHQFIMNDDD